MPSFIVKPKVDMDFYVIWSTIVDAPVDWGTKAELQSGLNALNYTDERFERADKNGTSARWPGFADDEQPFGWNDSEFMLAEWVPYAPEGYYYTLPRENLFELCMRDENDEDCADLLVLNSLDD